MERDQIHAFPGDMVVSTLDSGTVWANSRTISNEFNLIRKAE